MEQTKGMDRYEEIKEYLSKSISLERVYADCNWLVSEVERLRTGLKGYNNLIKATMQMAHLIEEALAGRTPIPKKDSEAILRNSLNKEGSNRNSYLSGI